MTKATTKKPANKKVASTKHTTKKPASSKPTAAYTGEVLLSLTVPLICNSIKDLNALELYCLGFTAILNDRDLNSNHCTADYIHRAIATKGCRNIHLDEVTEAFNKLNRRRLVKKNPMKSMDGSPDRYYTLSTRGQTLVNYMQCELWNVIRCAEMKL